MNVQIQPGQAPANQASSDPAAPPLQETLAALEEDDLKLTDDDMASILSSAFGIEEEVDPWLVTICSSLDEVDARSLQAQGKRMLVTLSDPGLTRIAADSAKPVAAVKPPRIC